MSKDTSENEITKDKGGEDTKASKEYLKDYLKKVYGVSISGVKSIQSELAQSGQHKAVQIVAEEFFICDGVSVMNELKVCHQRQLFVKIEQFMPVQ